MLNHYGVCSQNKIVITSEADDDEDEIIESNMETYRKR